MPKVSLIVSAYNIEAHISKCLQSLICQTFDDIEIIVVNDGSTDNTFQEIQVIAEKDNRISVIDQRNQGVMKSREIGFKEAKGEYLLFVDGDDWLAQDAIEILYRKAKQKDYDIVCYKFYFADGDEYKKSSNKNIHYEMLTGDDFLKLIMTSKINPSLWSKLMKRSFINGKGVTFPNGIAKAQDLAFACSLGVHSPKACLIDKYLYYYCISRSASITNSISPVILDVGKATGFIKQELQYHNMYMTYKEEFEFLSFIHNFWVNREVVYSKRNNLSKRVFKNWKRMGINIRKNIYFKEIMKKEPIKNRVISYILVHNYSLGSIYYKFHNIYTWLSKKSNLI